MKETHIRREADPEVQYTYPKLYFGAQVAFAKKWADITHEPLLDVVLQHTALFQKVMNPDVYRTVDPSFESFRTLIKATKTDMLTDVLYKTYTSKTHSIYKNPKTFVPNFFNGPSYTIDSKKQKVKMHFSSPDRKSNSPLSPDGITSNSHHIYYLHQDDYL